MVQEFSIEGRYGRSPLGRGGHSFQSWPTPGKSVWGYLPSRVATAFPLDLVLDLHPREKSGVQWGCIEFCQGCNMLPLRSDVRRPRERYPRTHLFSMGSLQTQPYAMQTCYRATLQRFFIADSRNPWGFTTVGVSLHRESATPLQSYRITGKPIPRAGALPGRFQLLPGDTRSPLHRGHCCTAPIEGRTSLDQRQRCEI